MILNVVTETRLPSPGMIQHHIKKWKVWESQCPRLEGRHQSTSFEVFQRRKLLGYSSHYLPQKDSFIGAQGITCPELLVFPFSKRCFAILCDKDYTRLEEQETILFNFLDKGTCFALVNIHQISVLCDTLFLETQVIRSWCGNNPHAYGIGNEISIFYTGPHYSYGGGKLLKMACEEKSNCSRRSNSLHHSSTSCNIK